MPKSKEMISDSESDSGSEVEVKQKSKPRKPQKKKQESSGSESEEEVKQKSKSKKVEKKKQESSGSESDDNAKSKKRSKKGDNGPNKKAKTEGSLQKNDQGEVYWELGNSKRITVRSFKGKLLIDIREYYDNGGEMRPGKKGIALQATNWQTLKSVFDEVDNYVKTQ